MKSWVVLILLTLSAAVSTYLYTVKSEAPTDADRISKALKGISGYLSIGSHLVFRCSVPASDLFPAYVSYYLTPVKLVPPGSSGNDTTLMMSPVTASDSTETAIIAQSVIIWQNKDDKYRYLLMHHR